jgi:hypothetical protein
MDFDHISTTEKASQLCQDIAAASLNLEIAVGC